MRGDGGGGMASKPAKKRKGDVKEDITNLQFGEDFSGDNVEALLNAEVKVRASERPSVRACVRACVRRARDAPCRKPCRLAQSAPSCVRKRKEGPSPPASVGLWPLLMPLDLRCAPALARQVLLESVLQSHGKTVDEESEMIQVRLHSGWEAGRETGTLMDHTAQTYHAPGACMHALGLSPQAVKIVGGRSRARTHARPTMQNSLEFCSVAPGLFQDMESTQMCKKELMNVSETGETQEAVCVCTFPLALYASLCTHALFVHLSCTHTCTPPCLPVPPHTRTHAHAPVHTTASARTINTQTRTSPPLPTPMHPLIHLGTVGRTRPKVI